MGCLADWERLLQLGSQRAGQCPVERFLPNPFPYMCLLQEPL